MMWRVVKIFLLLVLVAAAVIFGGDFGVVRVVWLGYLFETSVPVAAALFWTLVELLRLILLVILLPFKRRQLDDE